MYLHLINTHTPFRHKKIWKIKVPLKIKIFLWYLQKEVVLTKDNLARKNWKGSLKCVGCNLDESIQHLFLDCHYARMVWRMVYLGTGLTQPKSIRHLFGSWLSNQNTKIRDLIWVGSLLYARQSGIPAMTLFFIELNIILFYRLFLGERTGYAFGRICSVMSTTRTYYHR